MDNAKRHSERTKHIKLRFFFIKQYVDDGEFAITHCPTDLMVADVLTKPLHGEKFKDLRAKLLGYEQPWRSALDDMAGPKVIKTTLHQA